MKAKRDTRFKPGVSGNPAGRPKGSRNKVTGDYLAALCGDFSEHGVQAIETAREKDPMGYIKMVASLLPKYVEVPERPHDDLTDEELLARIKELDGEYEKITGSPLIDRSA